MSSKKETEKFNTMLRTQRNIGEELHDEINVAGNKLLTPNYIEKLTPSQQYFFYKFHIIQDILLSLINHEERFLKLCETKIKQNQKMLKLQRQGRWFSNF